MSLLEAIPLLTVDEFWEQYAGKPYELMDGRIVEVMPAGGESPFIGALFTTYLTLFAVIKHNLGVVTNAEGGYWLAPHRLVAPDVAFYTWEKHKLHTQPDKYRPFPPDLAIEVISPTDSGEEIDLKIQYYLESGVKLVWVVYPRTRVVMVFRPDNHPERLTEADMLSGGDVLPGFTLVIKDIFPPAPLTENVEGE